MTEPIKAGGTGGVGAGARRPASADKYGQRPEAARGEPANLADILERVLDKGIVIAGDIKVNLLDIELLTIKLRLVVASVDRAREMGIDWWEHDPTLASGASRSSASAVSQPSRDGELAEENRRLRERLAALESETPELQDRQETQETQEIQHESETESGSGTSAEPGRERRGE